MAGLWKKPASSCAEYARNASSVQDVPGAVVFFEASFPIKPHRVRYNKIGVANTTRDEPPGQELRPRHNPR